MSRLSLAQQIAELDAPAPPDVDPEAIFDSQGHADTGVSRAHYVEVGRSNLRKLHDSVADPKYDGVKVSRKQLMGGDEEEGGDHAEDASSIDSDDGGGEGEEELEGDAPSEGDEGDEEDEDASEDKDQDQVEEEEDIPDTSRRMDNAKEVEELASGLRKRWDEDRKKGIAVSHQIGVWDALLDARIQLQKTLVSANALPSKSQLSNFSTSPEYQASLKRMLEEASLLLEELLELQETLLEATEPITPPARKKRKIEDEDTIISYEAYLQEASQAASQLEQAYHPHLLQTLTKWSSKIQAVAPSVLLPSNRNTFSKDRQHIKSAVQLVDENLANHDKLLLRTQTRRGKGARLGAATGENQEKEDSEIFDDTDFYQQILRDVIDARDASGANDWMVVQKQKKAKKKVDTKASKGRKLRYEVHEKLQNFMAPIHVKGSWYEEQIDELFASLLGKGFEEAMNGQVDDIFPATEKYLSGHALEGFSVFG